MGSITKPWDVLDALRELTSKQPANFNEFERRMVDIFRDAVGVVVSAVELEYLTGLEFEDIAEMYDDQIEKMLDKKIDELDGDFLASKALETKCVKYTIIYNKDSALQKIKKAGLTFDEIWVTLKDSFADDLESVIAERVLENPEYYLPIGDPE